MFTKQNFAIAALLIVSLAILVAFQLWIVASAVLLLLAGFAIYGAGADERVQKLESRISLVQVSSQEFAEKACKLLGEVSESVTFLRGEMGRFSSNIENRVSAMEQHFQDNRPDTQKYYDLVQKVIDIENRISALKHAEAERNEQ